MFLFIYIMYIYIYIYSPSRRACPVAVVVFCLSVRLFVP